MKIRTTRFRKLALPLALVASLTATPYIALADAGDPGISLQASSIMVSAPGVSNVSKLVVRIAHPDGHVEERVTDGGAVTINTSGLEDGSYNIETWAIATQNGDKTQTGRSRERFKVFGGQVFTKEAGKVENVDQTSMQLTDHLQQMAVNLLDFVVPRAEAANSVVSSPAPEIEFEDTTTEGSDTDTREWVILGTDEGFSIQDDTNDLDTAANFTQVFKIEALGEYSGHAKIATDNTVNSIVIQDTGSISFADGAFYFLKAGGKSALGINTTTPADGVHAVGSGKSQKIRLENTTESTWTMGQDDDGSGTDQGDFQISILANGNGGPTGTQLSIKDESGNVGIGTQNPNAALEISRNDGTARLSVIDTSGTTASRVLANLRNNGGPVVQMTDTNTNDQWNFRTGSGGRFVIDSPGGNNPQMQVYANGNMRIQGALTQLSSQYRKESINTVDDKTILEKVNSLPIKEWSYIGQNEVRHIGPMSEDFFAKFGLGEDDKGITSIDTGGVALAAIRGLNQKLYEQLQDRDRKIEVLTQRLTKMESQQARIQQLEKLVSSLIADKKVAMMSKN